MPRFQKKKEKQNLPKYRTPSHFKGKIKKPKVPPKPPTRRIIQHKG